METRLTDIAQQCLAGAYGDTMSFPESVRILMDAGFEGYLVDYRRNTRTYYLPDGQSLAMENPHEAGKVGLEFDQAGIAAAVKWAQLAPSDYSYAEFNRRVEGFGGAGYLVSFPGRRVVYFGRTGETHVEHFPQ